MSHHALVGCPSARLETMALVKQMYVMVYNMGKNDNFPPYGKMS